MKSDSNSYAYALAQSANDKADSNATDISILRSTIESLKSDSNSYAYALAQSANDKADRNANEIENINLKLDNNVSGLTALYDAILELKTVKEQLLNDINLINEKINGGSF